MEWQTGTMEVLMIFDSYSFPVDADLFAMTAGGDTD
jgi:hypothetical protein